MAVWLVPALLQAILMGFDELWFHRRRGLPSWERNGHPLDTLTVAACWAWLIWRRPDDPGALAGYVALAGFSCLFITKDEPIHARVCGGGELWVHSVLFVLHPLVFLGLGAIWWSGRAEWPPVLMLGLTVGWAAYQFVYWRIAWRRAR